MRGSWGPGLSVGKTLGNEETGSGTGSLLEVKGEKG